MTQPDNLLNAIIDGDRELALRLAQEATKEQINHKHLSAAVKLYVEDTSGFGSLFSKNVEIDTELRNLLIKKSSDETLRDVKFYNPSKTIEEEIDEELGDKDVNRKMDKIISLIHEVTNHEIRERKDRQLAQDDPLLHAIKGSDKYKALGLIEKAANEQIKPEHLAAAIKEYYQGSGEMIASTVRSTEGSIVKSLAKKSSDEALRANQKHEIKSAIYEHSEDGMPTIDKVSDAKYVGVKAVTDELRIREADKSAHLDSITKQRTANTMERGR